MAFIPEDLIIETGVEQYKSGKCFKLTDRVVKESHLTIIVNEIVLITLCCLPEKLTELGHGYLLTEGLISSFSEIVFYKLDFKKKVIKFEVSYPEHIQKNFSKLIKGTSGCPGYLTDNLPRKKSEYENISINPSKLSGALRNFNQASRLFNETGGVHSSAFLRDYALEHCYSDIGRHNAIDKTIGAILLRAEATKNGFLLTTGRISSEIVKKSIRAGIEIIVSMSAPTSEALSIAERHSLYIIGFARDNRFNVYTGKDYLTLEFKNN